VATYVLKYRFLYCSVFAVQPWYIENISISWAEPLPNIKVKSFIVAMLGVGIHLLNLIDQ
jgi:hypothetical protein